MAYYAAPFGQDRVSEVKARLDAQRRSPDPVGHPSGGSVGMPQIFRQMQGPHYSRAPLAPPPGPNYVDKRIESLEQRRASPLRRSFNRGALFAQRPPPSYRPAEADDLKPAAAPEPPPERVAVPVVVHEPEPEPESEVPARKIVAGSDLDKAGYTCADLVNNTGPSRPLSDYSDADRALVAELIESRNKPTGSSDSLSEEVAAQRAIQKTLEAQSKTMQELATADPEPAPEPTPLESVCDALPDQPDEPEEAEAPEEEFEVELHVHSDNHVLHLMEDVFAKVDTNGDGVIDKTELAGLMHVVLAELGHSMENVGDVMSKADLDHNGVLSFEEFCSMMCKEPWRNLMPTSQVRSLQQLLKAFTNPQSM